MNKEIWKFWSQGLPYHVSTANQFQARASLPLSSSFRIQYSALSANFDIQHSQKISPSAAICYCTHSLAGSRIKIWFEISLLTFLFSFRAQIWDRLGKLLIFWFQLGLVAWCIPPTSHFYALPKLQWSLSQISLGKKLSKISPGKNVEERSWKICPHKI